jgi:XrtJ-associated TM-motif-TM protein
MKTSSYTLLAAALLLVVTAPLHAQTGCADSPENPTLVLALVGSAGAFVASARARIRARRSTSGK